MMRVHVLLARQLILSAQSIRHVSSLLCANKPHVKHVVKQAIILLVLYAKMGLWAKMEHVYPVRWAAQTASITFARPVPQHIL
jgi:hypothetical protein